MATGSSRYSPPDARAAGRIILCTTYLVQPAGAGRATTAAGVKLSDRKSRGGALPSFHVRDGEDRDKGREGYLGIGEVDVDVAGDRLDVVVAGD